jgi:hypothetical protein
MMREEDRQKIKELLGKIDCPSGFKCAASGFRYLCKAQADDSAREIVCMEEDPEKCVFASPNEGDHHCNCPLRRYICEKLGL